MIIGESARNIDLDVNPLKNKKLTAIRSSGNDEAMRLTPPRIMSLEEALEWINDDELVEIAPDTIRLRKKGLTPRKTFVNSIVIKCLQKKTNKCKKSQQRLFLLSINSFSYDHVKHESLRNALISLNKKIRICR